MNQQAEAPKARVHVKARTSLMGALMTLAVLPGASRARAQDSVLTELLLANRHPITLAEGRLGGAGGRLLVEAGKRSRFFLVGEEHGVGQMPPLLQALLTELRPAGYNTFAIEVSPLQGERLDRMTRLPSMRPVLDTMMSSWLTAPPFYTLSPERELLAAAMSPQGGIPPMRIWGLDYEVSADRFYLRELERLAPPAGRGAVGRARELADSGFSTVFTRGDPSKAFSWSAPDSVFVELRKAFGATLPARARAIIDVFERSARINRLFLGGRVYESNLDRSAYMRENLAAALAAAGPGRVRPRVLFKFGGSHMMRGLNYTHALDLGTAAAIVAEATRERSYHVLVLGGPGSKTARMNILKGQYEPIGAAEIEDDKVAWLRPAVSGQEWLVFDLVPVRLAYLRRRSQRLTPVQDRFLHAYDAIVVLTGSTPSEVVPLLLKE